MTLQQMADRAVALHHNGDLGEAERLYAEVLAKAPDNAALLFNHGAVLQALNRADEALRQFDRVLALRPQDAAAWSGRGAALAQTGRFEEALSSFDRALALRPHDGGVLFNRGMALMVLARFAEAAEVFGLAVSLRPDHVEAWNNRGNSLKAIRRVEEALANYDRAAVLAPGDAGLQLNRGLALTDLGRMDEALAAFDQALALQPDYAEAFNNRGLVLQYLGRVDEACESFAKAIQLDPTMAAAFLNYAGATKFALDDPRLAAMEALRGRANVLDETGRVQLELALAKANEDLGRYDVSFEHLQRGNRLRRAQLVYDEAEELGFFDRIEAVFTEARLRRLEEIGGGDPTHTPIFILGMPRSGSTLIEQILASHPQVYGAGELTAFHDAVKTIQGRVGASYPEAALDLDAQALRQIAAAYVEQIRRLGRGAAYVADKLPSNYYNVGLIHLAFPGARIIHTVRDPVDTCFSRFAKLFIDEQAYCYDLAELGRYHARYESLMAHWRRVLPPGAVLDVSYEDVVQDLEGQARRIVSYCGLEWDDRCLAFHEGQRAVRTPSAAQVRRPIYRSALGRAAKFDAFLDPLKAALKGRDGQG